jgi:hypothetical protein
MIILLFSKSLFLRIVIPMEITNPLHKGIVIPIKNEGNTIPEGNDKIFLKKSFFIFIFSNFFF